MGNSIRISNGKSGQTQSPGIPGGNPSGTSRWHSIHNLRCSLFGILESIPSKILGISRVHSIQNHREHFVWNLRVKSVRNFIGGNPSTISGGGSPLKISGNIPYRIPGYISSGFLEGIPSGIPWSILSDI